MTRTKKFNVRHLDQQVCTVFAESRGEAADLLMEEGFNPEYYELTVEKYEHPRGRYHEIGVYNIIK